MAFPQIEISSSIGREQSYQDTLYLEFQLKDHESYHLALMDGSTALSLKHRVIFSENGRYELEIIWDDPYLETGNYEIRLQAMNRDRGSSELIPISYSGLALELKGYAFLKAQDLELVLGGQSQNFSLNRSFDRVFANARDSLLYLCSKEGFVELRRWSDFTLVKTLGNGQRNYQSFTAGRQAIYLLGVDGLLQKVEGENIVGSYQYNSNLSFVPISATEVNGQLAVAFGRLQANGGELVILNQDFNAEVQNYYPLLGSNFKVSTLGEETIALAQEGSLGVSVYIYDLDQQTLDLQLTLTETQLFALGSVGHIGVAFCTEGGSHYYNTETVRINQFIDNFRYRSGESSRVADEYFWVNSTGGIHLVSQTTFGSAIYNTNLSNSAIDLALLYNK